MAETNSNPVYGRCGAPIKIRLERLSVDSGNCRVWTGSIDRKGYGNLRIEGRTERAHRASFYSNIGPIPEGLGVLHRCDNRRCIRPEHLFLGTNGDNTRDMYEKGRAATKLTDQDVLRMRALWAGGVSSMVIAKAFGVRFETASKIVNRKMWKHIPESDPAGFLRAREALKARVEKWRKARGL